MNEINEIEEFNYFMSWASSFLALAWNRRHGYAETAEECLRIDAHSILTKYAMGITGDFSRDAVPGIVEEMKKNPHIQALIAKA